ncbi:uncharacterized protein [Palaemon carinicauda]|uniref:uncharacterized protein n=1 Tax=Palaemon carinicauda TaxID=392227 RepID=UPI0035B61CA0
MLRDIGTRYCQSRFHEKSDPSNNNSKNDNKEIEGKGCYKCGEFNHQQQIQQQNAVSWAQIGCTILREGIKTRHSIKTPYALDEYSVASSAEFLSKVKGSRSTGTITSLEVESLFTNVPVGETIDLILETVYKDPSTSTLNIPEEALRTLLETCTKKAPFTTHRGHMYIQKDSVAMGSPLDVLVANFYTGVVEERVFSQIRNPDVYVRYIDDTFVIAPSTQGIEALRRTFEECSFLKFTVEHSNDGQLPFLDVLISPNPTRFDRSVYIKPTNIGLCLNGDSECPARYRALSHCSSWADTHQELDQVT